MVVLGVGVVESGGATDIGGGGGSIWRVVGYREKERERERREKQKEEKRGRVEVGVYALIVTPHLVFYSCVFFFFFFLLIIFK